MRYSFNDTENRPVVEKLLILAEECSEVSKAAHKILRFGIENRYPHSMSPSNKETLESEIGDILEVIDQIKHDCNLKEENIELAKTRKRANMKTWATH